MQSTEQVEARLLDGVFRVGDDCSQEHRSDRYAEQTQPAEERTPRAFAQLALSDGPKAADKAVL